MLHNLLNKIFNRDRGEGRSEKKAPELPPEEDGSDEAVIAPSQPKPASSSKSTSAKAAPPSKARNLDIPNRLEEGLGMKAVPENLKGKPKAWDVEITRLDGEGIWVMRTRSDEEPIPAEKGKLLSLVLIEDGKTITYDCPVLRIEPGAKEEILVAPPIKTLQEESQMRNIGARKHLRISFRLPAEIRKVHGTELGAPASAHTRDISMSGLALESSANFQKGEEIEIRILSWNFPLNVRASVIRVAMEDGKNTVAVTFPPDLSTISSDLISQFILENQRR